ncbi:MAG: GDSL-type esterase/lipase family protein [Phocaeicola sp.]
MKLISKLIQMMNRGGAIFSRKPVFISLILILFHSTPNLAQDFLLALPQTDKTLAAPLQDFSRGNFHKWAPIPLSEVLPPLFIKTQKNVIEDNEAVLTPVFTKLVENNGPVRIVHMGDSHVRGHLYPYVVRKLLEQDWGNRAVFPDSIHYRSSGFARETGQPGMVYHMFGINGATSTHFVSSEILKQITDLHPDLIIISLGTNEAHSKRYDAKQHEQDLLRLTSLLKGYCPNVSFLFTTPPGAYAGKLKSKVVNPRTDLVSKTIRSVARKEGVALWDLYRIVGGKEQACYNWNRVGMLRNDGIHFTPDGYVLQGELLYQAIIQAYNHYLLKKAESL